MTTFKVILNLLMLLKLRIGTDKLKIPPKLLQLPNPMLQHIAINLHKVLNLLSILAHKDTHQEQVLEPEGQIVDVGEDAVEGFRVEFF